MKIFYREDRFGVKLGRLTIIILVCFGFYQSVLYFGHQLVPNVDFTAFARSGHELLAGKFHPQLLKRAPLFGVILVSVGSLLSGPLRDLAAGWLINAVLHPFNLVLLWLIGREIVGKAALWIAIIAILNPWMVDIIRQPLVEPTLLFCVLMTFYLIFRGSDWSYLFAAITTMVRYEGAALILSALVVDLLRSRSNRERARAMIYAVLASLPLAVWIFLTAINWRELGPTHYLKELGVASDGKFILVKYFNLLWEMGFSPLILTWPGAPGSMEGALKATVKFLFAAGFIFGVGYGLHKRKWRILALLIFFIPYLLVHALHSFSYYRFFLPVFWIALIISWYGLQSLWGLINREERVPKVVVVSLQGGVLLIAGAWLVSLLFRLPGLIPASVRSASLPYVGIGVVVLLLAAGRLLSPTGTLLGNLAMSAAVCLVIVFNQFTLVRVVGNGQRDMEFKRLADWYLTHARPGEKMLCSANAELLRLFAPENKDNFGFIGTIRSQNPVDFVRECREKDITYLTWDSRHDLPGGWCYKMFGLERIAALARPVSTRDYQFVKQIAGGGEIINIFRLKPGPPE